MNHKLKIQERFHNQITSWEKTFEIRKNDRDFKTWDTIRFFVTKDNEYYEWIKITITNVFQEQWFWLEEWYCILSFKK